MIRVLANLAAFVAILVVAALPSAAATAEEDPVVAKVNGAEIRRSHALAVRRRLPAQMQQVPDDQLLPILVNVVIDTKLVAAEARKQNLQDDKEVREQIARLEDLVLEQVWLNRTIKQQVTDEAVEQRYKRLVQESGDAEEIRARHILVEKESEAREVIAELEKGAEFAGVARDKSIGPSASKGGDLGYFGEEDMVPNFSKAAFALDTGDFTHDPVQTQFGWHVIKVEDKRKQAPPEFEEVSELLRGELAREARAAYIQDLREKATIEKFDGAQTSSQTKQ